MVNENYFFWSGLATAAVVLGVGIVYRWSRQGGGSGTPTPASIYKRIKKGDAVRIGDFIVAFRDSPKTLSLSPSAADKVRGQLQSDLQGSAQRDVLTVAERLLDGATIANRKFERFQITRRTEYNEETHGQMLKDLWNIAFGTEVPYQRLSEKWGRLGFQGVDPQTDFRGGGVLALEQLHYFAIRHRQLFLCIDMIAFNDRQAELKQNHWFLLAVVSIQFTVQIATGEHPTFPQHLNLAWEDPYNDGRSPSMIREGVGAPAMPRGGEPPLEGFHELHAALMKEFFKQWLVDLPHVMSYTQWVPKVYATFFNAGAVLK